MSRDVVFANPSAEALTAAAYAALGGWRPLVVAGPTGVAPELATESFLSPFSFDLDVGMVIRGSDPPDAIDELGLAAAGVRLVHPDVPLAVRCADGTSFALHRDWARTLAAAPADGAAVERLRADGGVAERMLRGERPEAGAALVERMGGLTAREILDRHGFEHPELRCALAYLPLAFGIAPDRPGAGLALAMLAAAIDRIAVVRAGTAALRAALVDTIVRHGGGILEDGDPNGRLPVSNAVALDVPAAPSDPGWGFARLYAGVRGEAPVAAGHVTVTGIDGEDALYGHLADARAGRVPAPVGHFTVRTTGRDVDGAPLRSVVWHGLTPRPTANGAYALRVAQTDRCLAALDVRQPLFRLLWLPHETRAEPAEIAWEAVARDPEDSAGWLRAGPRSVLAALTGLATGRMLFRSLGAHAR